MEANEILTSLAKLEASLKEIESAKEQVQKTVGAYASVQKQIGDYTKALETISGSIKVIINDVQSQRTSLNDDALSILATLQGKADDIISMQNSYVSKTLESLKSTLDATNDSFIGNCTDTTDSLKKNTDEEIKKLDERINELKVCATNLNSLQESIKSTLDKIVEVKQDISDLQNSSKALNNAISGVSEKATHIDDKGKKLGKFSIIIIILTVINMLASVCSVALYLVK